MRLASIFLMTALTLVGLMLLEGPHSRAHAQSLLSQDLVATDGPTLISADEVVHDKALELVTARGSVEISQGDRILLADTVTYNLQSEVVTASGSVTLVEPTGEVLFAEYAELTGDLRDGFIKDVRLLLSDQSRMAAASGERIAGRYNRLHKGVFSPCALCREDPTRAPLWQLKANEVVHDEEEKVIEYRDAWMEFFGFPILYTPYFSHPDPTVKRKSGFLAPGFGASETLGATFTIPYFWAINEYSDFTFEPIITTKEGLVLSGEYRQHFATGDLRIAASATVSDRVTRSGERLENEIRGHIDASGRFNLDETWRWGFDAHRASDDTYLRVYEFSNDAILDNELFIEGFRGRNFARAELANYQGVRSSDDNGLSPLVLPELSYSMVSEPGIAGAIYRLDANVLNLQRVDGQDTRRLSLLGQYEIPYTSPDGQIINLTASLQGNLYWTDDDDPSSNLVGGPNNNNSDLSGRLFPQLALQWRYPWIQSNKGWHQVIEPIVQIVAAPNDFNPNEIPNEDSLGFEFDDTNIFDNNRLPGHDLVDSGTRVDFGVNWEVETFALGNVSAFLGQSYRLMGQSGSRELFAPGSGLEDRLSDIVGRFTIEPDPHVKAQYRFRRSDSDFSSRREELSLDIGPPALALSLDYLFIDSEASNNLFPDREEGTFGIRSQITDEWSISWRHRRDLSDSRDLSSRIGITYEDECFLIEGAISRTFFEDAELEPEDSFFVRVSFKHLGEFSSQ